MKEEMAEDGVVSESENATRSVICEAFPAQERISLVDVSVMRPFEENWVRSTCKDLKVNLASRGSAQSLEYPNFLLSELKQPYSQLADLLGVRCVRLAHKSAAILKHIRRNLDLITTESTSVGEVVSSFSGILSRIKELRGEISSLRSDVAESQRQLDDRLGEITGWLNRRGHTLMAGVLIGLSAMGGAMIAIAHGFSKLKFGIFFTTGLALLGYSGARSKRHTTRKGHLHEIVILFTTFSRATSTLVDGMDNFWDRTVSLLKLCIDETCKSKFDDEVSIFVKEKMVATRVWEAVHELRTVCAANNFDDYTWYLTDILSRNRVSLY